MKDLIKRLDKIKEQNLYRTENYLSSEQGTYVNIENKKVLLFSSNNYLGLSTRKEIKDKVIDEIYKYGIGTGGSRLTTGSYDIHKKLEIDISEFLQREDTILFNTGYMANLGVIQSICNEEYTIISDELNHASIVDGCRLSKAKLKIFKHNDMDDLKICLEKVKTRHSLIISEGIFSMDGDRCKLDEIIKLSKRFNSNIMIDDAHGFGVIGETGKGILEYFNVNEEIDIYLGTLSKAIGSEGAFVSGRREIIDFLRNTVRSYIYSTAINIGSCVASIEAIKIIKKEQLHLKLKNNIEYLCTKLQDIGIKAFSHGGIIKILVYDESKALKLKEKLLEKNILISAIRYPTVEKGQAILRICIMANHDFNDIDLFIEVMKEFKKSKII